ncbi:MAG: dihydrodipicolinate reductase [Actinomycetota bacterium]
MAIRVAQWSTGEVGRQALKMVLDTPELELAGVFAHGASKVGTDAGTVARRDETGVLVGPATVDEVLACEPDVVVHCPLPSARTDLGAGHDTDVIAGLLAGGADVITTVGYVWPWAYDDGRVERLEAACAAGASSLHGTGLNPGFQNELFPLVLSRLSARIDRVFIRESTVFDRYPSPTVIIEMMGFGGDPAAGIDPVYREWLDGLFRESVLLVAAGLGESVDAIELDVELTAAPVERRIAAGVVPAGGIDGQRWSWSGRTGDREVIRLETVFRAHGDTQPDWPAPGFVAEIAGRPGVRFEVGHWIDGGLLATAAMAVNAIEAVHDAAPGIRTVLDIPLVTGRGRLAT